MVDKAVVLENQVMSDGRQGRSVKKQVMSDGRQGRSVKKTSDEVY